jgi:hypothetical protein
VNELEIQIQDAVAFICRHPACRDPQGQTQWDRVHQIALNVIQPEPQVLFIAEELIKRSCDRLIAEEIF